MKQALIKRAKQEAIIGKGGFVRCSALSHAEHPGGNVKVIFRGKNNVEKAFWMSKETYDSLPLCAPFTPEDYRKQGPLIEARNCNIYDAELVPVLV
jgi:hypothetical protein